MSKKKMPTGEWTIWLNLINYIYKYSKIKYNFNSCLLIK
jgi:hypothetical protein